MSHTPVRLHPLRWLAMVLRLFAHLLKAWPLLLILLMLLSPITPHLLWEYDYRQVGTHKYKTQCRYIGVHGLKSQPAYGDCAFIQFINTHERTIL